jgi:hypothetical protein
MIAASGLSIPTLIECPVMERHQQRTASLAVVGALVPVASMFLEWYTLEPPEGIPNPRLELPTFTAFEALERADVAIVVAAAFAVAIAVAVVTGVLASPSASDVALIAVSLFALAVVLYRGVISPPGPAILGVDFDMKVSFGWFIGLAASLLMTVAGVLTYLAGPRLKFEAEQRAPPREE